MSRTQAESEQLVKTYQLDAVEGKVDTVLTQLKTIVAQTAGLATIAQLEAARADFKEKTDEAVKDIHKEYRSKFERTEWLYKVVVGEAIALLASAIVVIFLTRT